MGNIKHKSATSSRYNKESAAYDLFNEQGSKVVNKTLQDLFKNKNIKNIVDLTCGTGSQVLALLKKGFEVVGYDISPAMLKVARANAKKYNKVKFKQGGMRTTRAGVFDAVITIFNSVGHITKQDFNKTIKNIYNSLNPGGFYVFDIFNLNYLLYADNISKLTIE